MSVDDSILVGFPTVVHDVVMKRLNSISTVLSFKTRNCSHIVAHLVIVVFLALLLVWATSSEKH